jgi:hypothetical protein
VLGLPGATACKTISSIDCHSVIKLGCDPHASAELTIAATIEAAMAASYRGAVPVPGVDRVVEVKCRAHGFRELYRWLLNREILIVRADRSEPLVVLPLKLAGKIAANAEGLW